jgi:hypothetical protein
LLAQSDTLQTGLDLVTLAAASELLDQGQCKIHGRAGTA